MDKEPIKKGDRVRIRPENTGPNVPDKFGTVVLVYAGGIIVKEEVGPDSLGGNWPYSAAELEKIEE